MDNLTASTAGSWEKRPKEARTRVSYPAPDPSRGVRHRAKRASDMRRNREDPSGLAGGVNPYAYAGNDPVNPRDWSGRSCEPARAAA
jgi:RHS repeat-associated protein